MNTKTIRELRSIAKNKGFHGFYKLKKANLLALLLEQSSEEMPTPPPRGSGKERRPVLPVKAITSPQEMDEFEKEEMKKSRPVIKNRLSKLHDWLLGYVPKPIKKAVKKYFLKAKNSIMSLYDGAKKTLKDIVEKEAEKESVDVTPHKHERTLKGACRSFMMPGKPKTDVDSNFDQARPYIKTLIENQLKEMGPAKIILTLWVLWKKPIKRLIKLGPDDTTDDIYYEKIDIPFNSLMTEFLDDSDINDLIECMLAYIKAQTENPQFPESGFTLDKIMHLYINFHRLVLTRGSSYTELSKWLKSKKAVINPKNKDEECFKWAVIEALHHEEIKHHPERISLLRPYENQYNWKGLEFPVSIKKIDKFEKNNPGRAVNVLFSKKKSQDIYIAHRSERNVKGKKAG